MSGRSDFMASPAIAAALALVFIAASRSTPPAPAADSAAAPGRSRLVFAGVGGKLQYAPDENGNTIPDFSNCGYSGGAVQIPDAPVKATIAPVAGDKDDAGRIQAAIDQVSKLPLD